VATCQDHPVRAIRNTDDGIRVVDVAASDGSGIGDPVAVQPVSVGICGSDLHMIGLGMQGVTIGHEIAATYQGRSVAIQPAVYCGQCAACRRGDQHVCSSSTQGIFGIHRDGGMAEELVVDAQCLVELPDGVDAQSACLVEPIAVGVHAVNKADLEPDMKVAVIGAGSVGLVAAAAARRFTEVDIVARHQAQFDAAEQLGLRPLRDTALSSDYDVVIDAAGTESSLAMAIAAIRPAGTIVVPGIYWTDVTVPGLALCLKETQLKVALYYGYHDGRRETDMAAELLGALPDLPAALISHRFELERAADAFATAADRGAGAIKVVVDVS
jgi:2-desacetyl-2-hydroxyethyl bacteriochlorophyllide A dehydrogenase